MEDKIDKLFELIINQGRSLETRIDEQGVSLGLRIDEQGKTLSKRIDELQDVVVDLKDYMGQKFEEQHQNMVALNNKTRKDLGEAIAEVSSKLDSTNKKGEVHDSDIIHLKSNVVVLQATTATILKQLTT